MQRHLWVLKNSLYTVLFSILLLSISEQIAFAQSPDRDPGQDQREAEPAEEEGLSAELEADSVIFFSLVKTAYRFVGRVSPRVNFASDANGEVQMASPWDEAVYELTGPAEVGLSEGDLFDGANAYYFTDEGLILFNHDTLQLSRIYITLVLAHELRHHWQNFSGEFVWYSDDPKTHAILKEFDAHLYDIAFAEAFAELMLELANGIPSDDQRVWISQIIERMEHSVALLEDFYLVRYARREDHDSAIAASVREGIVRAKEKIGALRRATSGENAHAEDSGN